MGVQRRQTLTRVVTIAAVIYIFVWSAAGVSVDFARIKRGLPAVGRIVNTMFPQIGPWPR